MKLLIVILLEKIKPMLTEKDEFEKQNNYALKSIYGKWDYRKFDAQIKMELFEKESMSTKMKFSIDTSMIEIKPVVKEKLAANTEINQTLLFLESSDYLVLDAGK